MCIPPQNYQLLKCIYDTTRSFYIYFWFESSRKGI